MMILEPMSQKFVTIFTDQVLEIQPQVTQVAGVNPYANWPEGPRLDWSQVRSCCFYHTVA